MKFTLENIITVVAVVLTEAWFLKGYFNGTFDFEPAIAFIVAFGAIFAKDPIKDKLGIGGKASQHDRELFNVFMTVLPVEPTIVYLKEHDFGNAFRRNFVEPLYEFVATWDSVEKEFLNKKIEKRKKGLYQIAKKLASEIAGRTVPVSDGNFASVFSDHQRNQSPQRPAFVVEDAKVLNDTASEFVPIYEDFVRFCKKELIE